MTEFKPGSIEHRKKVIEKYHIEDGQKILDMPYDKFEIFCTGLAVGEKYGGLRATYSVLKNPDPQQVIDMMHELSEEDLNKVLDEWCEPLESCHEEAEMEGTLDYMKGALVDAVNTLESAT